MLTPNQLDKLPDSMLKLMSELENEIISDICRRVSKADLLTPTAEWQLWKANQLTISSREVKKRIAAKLKRSEKEIKELYTDAVKTAIREDEKIYKMAIAEGILSDDYREKLTNYTRSAAFSNALKKGLKNTNGVMRNLTNSAAAAADRQLSDALDLAYLKCINGAFTPQEAIFDAVKKLGAEGIKCVKYDSGRTDQLDVAVRRAVVTSIGKTCGDLQLGLAKEMDCQLVEVSSHLGARPSHAEWQGKVYSLVKGHPKYPYFYDATGYGRGDGLCGWNCRHSFFPYFEGLSVTANEPAFDSETNRQVYEATQRQRAYERAIRKSKRELAALDASREGITDTALKTKYAVEFERKSAVLKRQEARLAEHLKATGLLPDNSRVRVDGFGRSVAQKAVWAAKRATEKSDGTNKFLGLSSFAEQPVTDESISRISKVTYFSEALNDKYRNINIGLLKEVQKHDVGIEVSAICDSNMNQIGGYTIGKNSRVKIADISSPYHAFHNHPSGETFSPVDLIGLTDRKNMLSITAQGNNGANYICMKTPKSDSTNYRRFLNSKTSEIIYQHNGKGYTYNMLKNEKRTEQLVSSLNENEKIKLKQALIKLGEECAKGGENYGFKYYKTTP